MTLASSTERTGIVAPLGWPAHVYALVAAWLGVLLLFDERYPSRPAELRDPTQILAVMAQWYELTWGNVLNTREEIATLLAGAGLTPVQETALSRFYLVIASRRT